jgi:hypothetical protein
MYDLNMNDIITTHDLICLANDSIKLSGLGKQTTTNNHHKTLWVFDALLPHCPFLLLGG